MNAQWKLIISLAAAICLVIVNLISFCMMAVDKSRARNRKRRIPERTLFLWALLFGGLGGMTGMYVFRHKTKHWYFALFFPMLTLLQMAAVWMAAVWIWGV